MSSLAHAKTVFRKTLQRLWHQLRKPYLRLRYTPVYARRAQQALQSHEHEWAAELHAVEQLRSSGFYSLTESLSNDLEPYEGVNFLNYPSMSGIMKTGVPIGWIWGENQVELASGDRLMAFQAQTDLETNFPLVFDTYRPEVVFDFGTATGASARFFRQQMLRYCHEPIVISIDIQDLLRSPLGDIHRRNRSEMQIRFVVGDAVGEQVFDVVRQVCNQHSDKRWLISFDDDHSAIHVFQELTRYAPLVKSGDVIIVQDTWDQGLYSHMFSPLLSVLRFINKYPDFQLDTKLMRALVLPCNFVHGVLVRR